MARRGRPSLTARIIALTRASATRPTVPTGDPDAEDRLARSLRLPMPVVWRLPGMPTYVAARTQFFDELLLHACDSGTSQVVIVGAGYDGRSLRFRRPGVVFFEIDHPKTQADKRARLAELDIDAHDVRFAPVDFGRESLADALAAAGHDRAGMTHFVCEGVTPYLPKRVLVDLLQELAARAAPGSTLSVDFAGPGEGLDAVARARLGAVRLGVALLGERMVTLLTAADAEALLRDTGWTDVAFRSPPPGFPVHFASAIRPA